MTVHAKKKRILPTLAALLGLAACSSDPPTQLVVRIATDLRSGDELTGFRVLASRRNGAVILDLPVNLRDGRIAMPTELGLLPDDPDDPRFVDIEVTAELAGNTANFAQHAAVRFVHGRVVVVEMFLARTCQSAAAREACEALGQSCGAGGRCVAVDRESPTDAGAPDARPLDARPVDVSAVDVPPPDVRVVDVAPPRDNGPTVTPDAGTPDAGTPDAGPRDAGCVRATCDSLRRSCGAASDGCGRMLACGMCPEMEMCSPAGVCVECTSGMMRDCHTGLGGRCNAGRQACADAHWAACVPNRGDECDDA